VVSRRRNEQKPKTETKEKTDEAGTGISPRRPKFCSGMNSKSLDMGMFENWLWDHSDQLITEFWRYPKKTDKQPPDRERSPVVLVSPKILQKYLHFLDTENHEWEHYRRYPKLIINYINYIYIDWISINRRLIMDIFPPWVPSFRKRIAGHRGFKDGHHPEARSTDQVAEQGRAKGWPVDP